MWLVRKLVPDHKTIADFRRINGAAIVATCRAFVLFCREQGLFTARLVAIDVRKYVRRRAPCGSSTRSASPKSWKSSTAASRNILPGSTMKTMQKLPMTETQQEGLFLL
jgi:hypothetical protein